MLIKQKSMLPCGLNVALVFNFRDIILGFTGSWLLPQCALRRVLQRKIATFCWLFFNRSYFSSLLLGFAMSINVMGVLETVCWSFAVHKWTQILSDSLMAPSPNLPTSLPTRSLCLEISQDDGIFCDMHWVLALFSTL